LIKGQQITGIDTPGFLKLASATAGKLRDKNLVVNPPANDVHPLRDLRRQGFADWHLRMGAIPG
jgi:hypothetical protein